MSNRLKSVSETIPVNPLDRKLQTACTPMSTARPSRLAPWAASKTSPFGSD
jgi:hypothetical protein